MIKNPQRVKLTTSRIHSTMDSSRKTKQEIQRLIIRMQRKHYQIPVKTNADLKNQMSNQIKQTTKDDFIYDQKNRRWVQYGMAQGGQN